MGGDRNSVAHWDRRTMHIRVVTKTLTTRGVSSGRWRPRLKALHAFVTGREPMPEVAATQAAQETIHMILGLSNPSKLARPLENARRPG
ncbi:hypothetical protein V6N11_067206 [Hibiscus sabdariffa]|uniref:Uncharacterized protein n=1 Tax=Hibiscus sabdariffa TaxID=183260 RepID=A0ABR2SQW4_9ROSI